MRACHSVEVNWEKHENKQEREQTNHNQQKELYGILPPLGCGAAVLLSPPPQVDQQPVLEGVDGFVSVQAREAGLALCLSFCINSWKSQEVVLITEATDSPYIQKRSIRSHLTAMKGKRVSSSLSGRNIIKEATFNNTNWSQSMHFELGICSPETRGWSAAALTTQPGCSCRGRDLGCATGWSCHT